MNDDDDVLLEANNWKCNRIVKKKKIKKKRNKMRTLNIRKKTPKILGNI